LKNKML